MATAFTAWTVTVAEAASSWSPTVLVNTEAFQTIDDGDGATNIELRFGDTVGEKLIYNVSEARFEFTRSLQVGGSVTATGALAAYGNLEINADNGAADAVLTFGNASGDETLTFNNAVQQFQFSANVRAGSGLQLGNYAPGTGTGAGTLRWTGTDVQAYDGNGWTSLSKGGKFVGLTGGSTTGSFTSDALVGYQAANALCAAAFAGSHMCRSAEIISTVEQNLNAFAGATFGWVAQGPPGYTANSNDCNGWTTASSTYLGAWWEFSTDLGVTIAAGGGKGFLVNCSVPQPISCCR